MDSRLRATCVHISLADDESLVDLCDCVGAVLVGDGGGDGGIRSWCWGTLGLALIHYSFEEGAETG